ncbi:MAG: hypothetical protein CVU90_06835 [Firmicutes bacterium HGW-Firmicutes-15]|nr:MAG: hypothetical protein CVU90_06835 [Firmicutes bacterium HGW-Firmicutes-15]
MLREIRSKSINTLLLLTVAIYLTLLLGSLPGSANAETGIVSGSVVNIRSGPGTQYNIAGTIYKNASVEMLSKTGEWYKVKYGTVSGWINQSLLSKNTSEKYLKVNQDVVNLRSGPGITNKMVAQVYKGDSLVLLEVQGEWNKVKTASGQVAYIRSDMVGEENMPAAAVSVSAPASPIPSLPPATGLTNPIVMLDGKQMAFEVLPRIENNRVMVPLRAIFEAMGAQVEWNQATQTATAVKDNITVVLPLNSTQPTVNGVAWQLDVPAKIVQQRTLAPLRFVGEALGGTATWDQANCTVVLQTPPPPEPVLQPLPPPVPQFEGLRMLSERDDSGLRIVMGSSAKLETKIDKTSSKVRYEFSNRQIDGTSYIEVPFGTQILKVQGSNQVNNAVVEIQIPAGVEYRTATELEGKKEVLTIPNFITGVERKTFGSSGEKITISSNLPLTYTSSQTGTRLEVVFSNVLPGKALSDYKYDSRLISSMGFKTKTTGSVSQTVLTLVTNKAAKFSLGSSSDGTTLNIMFIDQSEIQPRVPMVVLDPGHGGKDTGARGYNVNEKDVNLDVALKVGQILTQKGIKVGYTRTDDTYLSLIEEATVGNLYNAAIFVGIHCNSCDNPGPSGTETWYYAPSTIPELYIQKDERYSLATYLQKAMIAKLGLNDRGVKHGNLAVLRNTQMPSALVEMAFINSPTEGELLKQQNFRQMAAQAIADGIAAYMKESIKR